MAGAPTSYGYPGSVNSSVLADWLTRAAAARFSVGGKDDWKVSVQPGLDRGIRINGGTGVGDSVMDVFPDYDTRSLPLVASGSQWFLIAARRNWSTPASTNFVVVPGSGSRAIPSHENAPGQISDQEIALVRVQAGNTVVQEIIDLRAWAGNGGVEAADVLGREQLARPGAAVKIGTDLHRYEYDPANGGSFAWKTYPLSSLEGTYTPNWAGFEYRGDTFTSTGRYSVTGKLVRVTTMIQSGANPSLGLATIGFSLPPGLPVAAGPMAIGDGVWNSSGSGGNVRRMVVLAGPGQTSATIWAVPGTDQVRPPGVVGWPWGAGHAFHATLEYFTS